MSTFLGSCIFLVGSFLTFFLFFKIKPAYAFFRSIALVLVIAIVTTLNINWLLGKSVSMGVLGSIVLCFFAYEYFFSKSKLFAQKIRKSSSLIPILVFLVAFLLAGQYFGFRWDEPRYATPDPGTHYLYMSQTVETGMMPFFSESRIFPAMGFIKSWEFHHQSYFPGSTAVFFVIDHLSPFRTLVNYQVFNAFFYALLCGYFFALSMKIIRGEWRWISFVLFGGALLFGVFFDFLVNGFSTQLLGLFFLLFFVDMYSEYERKRMAFLFPVLGLAGVVVTYIYWLPVALLFILFEKISQFFSQEHSLKNILSLVASSLVVPTGACIVSFGYCLIVYKVRLFGHASDDGGFPVQKHIVADVMAIIPFFLFSTWAFFFRWKKTKKAPLLFSFLGATLVYAFFLAVLFWGRLGVSHYAAYKVLYLLLPLVWVFAFSHFGKWMRYVRLFFVKRSVSIPLVKFRKYLLTLFGLYVVVGVGCYFLDISFKFIPLHKKNFSFAEGKGVSSNLYREQSQMIDKLNSKYAWTLQDGKVLVIAPPDTALWIYAYGKIWPRTYSLLGPEKKHPEKGVSPMDMYSSGIADYQIWFQNDPKKIFVYFDNGESKKWIKEQKFPQEEYDIVHTVGDNRIYSWKGNNLYGK